MENASINISTLNDFVFCPYSIYLHNVYSSLEQEQYHEQVQVQGKNAHESIDTATHNTRKDVLLGMTVYSEKYGLCGKIDQYYQQQKRLVERKNFIKQIYDGYLLQLYAQYFCLTEMGFAVEQLAFHSLKDNKTYPVALPDADKTLWFATYVEQLKSYNPAIALQNINPQKCAYCIYRPLCDQCEQGSATQGGE